MALVLITLTPKGIRDAFVAQLIARGVAGGNVVSTRPRPWGAADAPGVNVFSPGSNGSSISAHLPRFETIIQMICAATVVLPEGGEFEDKDAALGDAVDAMEIAIKGAILGDDVFASSFKRWVGIAVRKGFEVEGQGFRGHVRIEFRIAYNEQFQLTNLAGYDDLEQLDISTTIGPLVLLVTHAEDRIVTHAGDTLNIGGTQALLLRPLYRVRLVTHAGDNLVAHAGNNLVDHVSTGFEVT